MGRVTNSNSAYRRGPSTLPTGETIVTYDTYERAQTAVEALIRAEIPAQAVSVVGTDLRSVERITARLTWGRVAVGGAISGGWFGLFLGVLLFLWGPAPSLGLLAASVLIGAGAGMTFQLVTYGMTRRRRDFLSVMQVVASRYAIVVEPASAAQARSVLGVGPTGQPRPSGTPLTYGEATDAARAAREPREPPRYGELAPEQATDAPPVPSAPGSLEPQSPTPEPSPGEPNERDRPTP